MTGTIRNIIILLGLAASLAFFNLQIKSAQAIKDDGDILLLQLRPVDPREIMMGDFMALAYDQQAFPDEIEEDLVPSGSVILDLDDNNVGVFARFDDGSALGNNQMRLNYIRLFNENLEYGGKRYYFQEGTARVFEAAQYGVFKVDKSGRAILSDMADENFNILSALE